LAGRHDIWARTTEKHVFPNLRQGENGKREESAPGDR